MRVQELILLHELPLHGGQICHCSSDRSFSLELWLSSCSMGHYGVSSTSPALSFCHQVAVSRESQPPAISVLSGKHLSLLLSVQEHPP